MSDSTSASGAVPLIRPDGAYWGRSYTTHSVKRSEPAEGTAPASVASGASPSASLDRCTYVARDPPPTETTGEWHVQLTEVGGYGEFIAVEDADGSLLRHFRKSTTDKDYVSDNRTPEQIEELRLERLAVAGRRAKKNCQWKVRVLGADRLWTLTKRGGIPTRADAWELWGQFERYCSRRFTNFKCVVVMELHKGGGANDGSWHIHFCTNRYLPVESMRLWWHRILTGRALQGVLRGDESPGNIDVSRVLGGGKLCAYLSKYLSKSLTDELDVPSKRVKRFASSKGIGEPTRTRMRMAARGGEHVYRLRLLAEAGGWKVEAIFEGTVAGRALVWMKCKGPAGGSEASRRPPTAALANALRAGYS